ncbi:hypothetical protein HED48_22540 [Ochrobactrum intermedium]|nr:hypothetical protein [Brucella intermedia]
MNGALFLSASRLARQDWNIMPWIINRPATAFEAASALADLDTILPA